MKNNLCLGFLLFLSACSYQNKNTTTENPIDSVVVNSNRLEMQDLSVIPIRSKTVTGEMTTFNSEYIDIAKVLPPTFNNSYGDVQATAVEIKDNKAYIVYNVSGNEVGGAIDIVDVSNPSSPSILSTYVSDQYEFSDIVIKDNNLYVSGHQKNVGAILMVISVANNQLDVVSIKKINGIYATDLWLYGNTLSVMSGSSGGLTEFDVSLSGIPTEISYSEIENGLSVSGNSYFSFYVNGDQDTSINSHTKTDFLKLFENEVSIMPVHSKKISNLRSEAPTRIKLKNSILYSLNSNAKKLDIIDASQAGKSNSNLETVGSLSVSGTANGFDLDQQKIFLALGEDGVQIADLKDVKQPSESGKLLFKNDNGSSNNVWARETINNVKYVFIAYGRQGLRIISKKNISGTDRNVVVSAKGDFSQGEYSKFQIKVNGVPVKTFETTDKYEQYLYVHPTALSNNDKVEAVFVNNNNLKNPVSKRNLFINYMWVSDKYCYQSQIITKNTLNDFGLFENGDALVYNKGTCQTVQSNSPVCDSNSHIDSFTCVPNVRSCSVANGIGEQVWSTVNNCGSSCGSSWSSCEPKTCNAGYFLINGECKVKACNPQETTQCLIPNGTGIKTCKANGLEFSNCEPTNCNSGYLLIGGVCTPQLCTPNSTTACPVTNGTGTKTCDSSGSSYGSCVLTTCDAGYKKVNGACVLDPNYCPTNGGTRPCGCDNGSGVQLCQNNQWQTNCTPTVCNSGFTLVNGACVPKICNPNSTTSCPVTNGSGTKTCNSSGLAYGSCTTTSCNSGFTLQNGSCVPQVCQPNSTVACLINNFNGVKTCSSNGLELGGCVSTGSCTSGYSLVNGACVPQICHPNSTTSCPVSNGSGIKTCSSNGTTYGSCTTTSCNSGYYLDNGTCKPQICHPHEVKACNGENGSGIKSCSANGSSWSGCQITECNSGYDKKFTKSETEFSFCSNEYENCVTNTNNVLVKYGKNGIYTAEQNMNQSVACSNSVFGDPLVGTVKECLVKGTFSCELRVCKSNEYDNGTACVPQLCTPNSTKHCEVNNFNGTQTCSANGSSYGSCVSTGSCKSGYTLKDGVCIPQLCTPNSTTSCSIQNGQGTKTCSSDGLSYGYCNPISCNAGTYPIFTLASTQLVQNGNFSASAAIIGGNNQILLSNLLSSPYGTWDIYSSLPSWTLAQGSGIEIWSDGQGGGFIELDGNENYQTTQPILLEKAEYLLTSDYVPRTANVNDNKVSVYLSLFGNIPVLTFNETTATQSGWKKTYKVFNSQSSLSSSLMISGEGLSTSYGGFIDNISIKKIVGDGKCSSLTCTPNSTKACSINNFTGTQTCNSEGSEWGSCVSTGSCQNGYTLKNGACVPQICTPSSTASCLINNGAGTKTCSTDGLSYGSCTVTSCNSGFYSSNNTCVAQECTPNSTQSCLINNFNGTKTCTANGSAWGSCVSTGSCQSGYVLKNGSCVVQVCTPNSTTSCPVSNGLGSKTCDSLGLSYGSCTVNSCHPGYKLSNNTCVIDPNYCSPNGSTKSCSSNNGTGTQSCSSNQWSSTCVINSCNNGYTLQNGTCVPQVCSPNSTATCASTNGTGIKTCSSNGLSYGSCTTTACNAGFVLDAGTCKPKVCNAFETKTCQSSNGSGIQSCDSKGLNWGSCQITSCNAGYDKKFTASTSQYSFCSNEYEDCVTNANNVSVKYGKNGTYTQDKILSQTFACSNSVFGDSLIGTVKECLVKGTFSCEQRVCSSSEYDNGSKCVPKVCTPNSTKACEVNNFTGSQTCSANGSTWGSCISTGSCKLGYSLQNGQCVAQVCHPNSTTSCSISNGAGTKTCDSKGLSYGSCTVSSCHPGYKLSNNTCVTDVNYCSTNGSTKSCGCSNGSGIQTCTNNQWSSTCTPKVCNAGYSLVNGSCVAQLCTPNSSLHCFVSNGIGSKSCSSNGMSYGSCTAKSCNYGYVLDKGKCVKPVCHH